MRKPGINVFLGVLLLVVTFGITAPALWGATQLIEGDEVAEDDDTANGGGATGGPVSVTIVSENLRFDPTSFTASTGVEVTVTHDNRDAGVQHNVAFYTNRSAQSSIFVSEIVVGPVEDVFTFTSPATAGSYFYRCDVHPDVMTGTFEVQ